MADLPSITIHRSTMKALRIFNADRLRWLDEAAAAGPLVGVRMGVMKLWVVTDADVARTMLVTDGASWTRPPAVLSPIRVAIGDNLFSQSDEAWARLQPLVAPAFRSRALAARLVDVDALVDAEVRALPRDATVDLELAMGRIALIVAAWVLLGDRLEPAQADTIAGHERAVVGWVGTRLGEVAGFVPIARGARARAMKEHRRPLRDYADAVIRRARRDSRGPEDDALGALMAARPGGKPLTPEQLRSHVLGLFLAGNETTAAALSWALVHGSNAPEQWRLVRDDAGRWARPFVTETLRLTPAVWGVPRTPTRPGVTISAAGATARVRRGQPVTVNLRGLGRDPRVWADPLRFDITRHEARGTEEHRTLIPFGLGPRGCIGQQLALAELHAALPALARHGDVEIDGEVQEDPAFALRVRGGLRGKFRAPRAAPTPAP